MQSVDFQTIEKSCSSPTIGDTVDMDSVQSFASVKNALGSGRYWNKLV
jgi:hypothetical protein